MCRKKDNEEGKGARRGTKRDGWEQSGWGLESFQAAPHRCEPGQGALAHPTLALDLKLFINEHSLAMGISLCLRNNLDLPSQAL
jgi:hypothetical protein